MRYQKRSADYLAILCRRSVGNDAPLLRHQIKKGVADFFSLDATHYVTRGEITTRGKEFVICCAEGKGLGQTIKPLLAHAKAQGFTLLRYHPKTPKAGLAMARIAGIKAEQVTQPGEFYIIAEL